jgi:hypothetical protein
VIELAHPSPPSRPSASAIRTAISNVGRLVALTSEGLITVVEPEVNETWLLATPHGRSFATPQIARDGRRVLALTPAGLVVWRLDLPESAADTSRWLEAMTNAVVGPDDPSGPLAWR